ARGERSLPPVEIYEVRDPLPVTRVAAGPSLVVSGDGAAWPPLARSGVLDQTGPVRYSGTLDGQDLSALLHAGAPLVITDSNRRRTISIAARGETFSTTLAAGEGPKTTPELFARPGSQTVAWYPDATEISS